MSEATQRDRERYLTSGLVSVDCRFCHVSVDVKKLGPGTHVGAVELRSIAALRVFRRGPRSPAASRSRARSCPKLADSIKHAVAEGCLEEVVQRTLPRRRLDSREQTQTRTDTSPIVRVYVCSR